MKVARRAVQESSKTLRSLRPSLWPAAWYPLEPLSGFPGVFHASVLTFESSFSTAC